MFMGTKTLTITEDAYARLAAFKDETESFSDVIAKITGKVSLLSIAGILSEEEAVALERKIKRVRKESRNRLKRIAGELTE